MYIVCDSATTPIGKLLQPLISNRFALDTSFLPRITVLPLPSVRYYAVYQTL